MNPHAALAQSESASRFAGIRRTTERLAQPLSAGDVWEWTRSDYSPYPGYRSAPGDGG